MQDIHCKHAIRKGRLLLRSLDLVCNLSIMATVLSMLVFASRYADTEFEYVTASGEELTARVFPRSVDSRPSRGLLAVACLSLLFSILVMIGYIWSHKTSGKISSILLIVELIICFSLGMSSFAASSTFQIPKLRKLVRTDLWASFCSPIRKPAPGAPLLPPDINTSFYSLCLAGDWSVMCGFLSGSLQIVMAITVILSLIRLYTKHKRRIAEVTMDGL
ncbi:hypothetical protein DSO57_1023588 [Entomophthora muscae]|uniref:Uncharacterized protein n=1 Tax=Entomophthora muscae TaxID=34485 RepID=A0ACC2U1C4_9FUNG|nr:hypothetical protein DSO57_1023588 [Entomophthora muscae]